MTPIPCNERMSGGLFSRTDFWCLCLCLNGAWKFIFIDNALEPLSHTEQVQGGLFSRIRLWNLCDTLSSLFLWRTSLHLYRAMSECKIAHFHGQASDAYVWRVQGSLFSWTTLWYLCQYYTFPATMNIDILTKVVTSFLLFRLIRTSVTNTIHIINQSRKYTFTLLINRESDNMGLVEQELLILPENLSSFPKGFVLLDLKFHVYALFTLLFFCFVCPFVLFSFGHCVVCSTSIYGF